MTGTRGLFLACMGMAAAGLLAACSTAGDGAGPVTTGPAPTGFDGEWASTDGVAISRFRAGAFETIATDTGNRLASGTYTLSDPRTAQITVMSLIRNTTTNVTCALASTSQLNCTSSAGQQFVLTRRA